jgi:hypothetical protein
LTWGVYIADAKSIQKHTKLIEHRSVDHNSIWEFGNFSQGVGTPGTERDIAFFTAGDERVKQLVVTCHCILLDSIFTLIFLKSSL